MSDTSRDSADLHPLLRERWRYLRQEWKRRYPALATPFLTATYRGPEDQQAALERGDSNLAYGQSLHNFEPAYAFDLAFNKRHEPGADWNPELFEMAAEILKPTGLEWGGDWQMVDGPHFQLPASASEARGGVSPSLPPVPDLAGGMKLVILIEGEVRDIYEIEDGMDVVVRYAPGKERVYLDVRKEGD